MTTTATDRRQAGNPVRGLAAWKPNRHTETILEDILGVLAENRSEWPVDARSIEYALMDRGYRKDRAYRSDQPPSPKAQDHLRKAGKSQQLVLYAKVVEVINRARRAGIIPWKAISDDFYSLSMPTAYRSPRSFLDVLQAAADDYQRPLLRFQLVIPELWVEARGMVKRVNDIAHEYGVQVWSSGGMDHLEPKHRLALFVVERAREGKRTVVLHIGDHDDAGRKIFRVLREDVTAFAEDIAPNGGGYVRFERLWVTTPQAWKLHELGKSQGIDEFGLPEVQAEAIPIADRPAIIREAIEQLIDLELYRRVRDHGLAERERLKERVR